MNFKGLIIFDLALLQLTELPVIAHDSNIFKNIADLPIDKIMELYNQIDKSILCLQKFADFPFDISIRSYIIINYICRLLWLIVIAVIAYMVSYRFSYKVSVIISLCMLIPHVLYVLGVGLAKKMSIIAAMDINRMFDSYGYGLKSVLLFIIVFLIMEIILVYNYKKAVK